MIMMWKALLVFFAICVFSWLVVTNLYLTMELRDLKEKLSWYTQPIRPVPSVIAEVSDDEA